MKTMNLLGWSSALWLSIAVAQAQETTDLEKLNKQLKQMQENFEKLIREQQAQIDALKKQLATSTNALPAQTTPQVAATTPPPSASTPWRPSDPIRVAGSSQNYINLSVDALMSAGTSTERDIESLQLGGHDPKQRGFTLQNLETVFEGRADPYFRGQANVVLQLDLGGETTIEAEEAYLETMSLPWNLQVKAGQFFTEFGRINPVHPHAWDFVDQPLVNGRFLGGDGLRNPGARVSWLMPSPFYSELYFAVQNSQGETAHSFRNSHEGEPFLGRVTDQGRVRDPGDMIFAPRYAASFDLRDSQTLVAGASAALGPNSTGASADTQIYGIDLFWKWKSPHHHGGFPFVTWQTEAMMRRFEAARFGGEAGIPALPREALKDYGFYTQLAYGFRKGWVTALRGDFVAPDGTGNYERLLGTDPDRASRWRVSPNLTWYPSEFSKIRLQYNLDHRDVADYDHSVWLQVEFLLGSHAAHKF